MLLDYDAVIDLGEGDGGGLGDDVEEKDGRKKSWKKRQRGRTKAVAFDKHAKEQGKDAGQETEQNGERMFHRKMNDKLVTSGMKNLNG